MATPDQLPLALVASLIAALVTTAGVLIVRRHEAWAKRNSGYFAAFAAGVLITVSFLHLIPRSLQLEHSAGIFLLAGYVAMHLVNRFIQGFVCDRPKSADFAIGLVPMLGIGFHSLADGAVYAVTFSVSTFTGIATAIGMVLHEFPEGIVTYVLLLRGGFGERTAFWLALLTAAFTTPIGAFLAYPHVQDVDQQLLGQLLSLSAGALVYVGATHLLPAAEREKLRYSLLAVAAGMMTAVGIVVGH